MATHDIDLIDRECFDLLVFSEGRNLANGEPLFYREEADYLNLRREYLNFSVAF